MAPPVQVSVDLDRQADPSTPTTSTQTMVDAFVQPRTAGAFFRTSHQAVPMSSMAFPMLRFVPDDRDLYWTAAGDEYGMAGAAATIGVGDDDLSSRGIDHAWWSRTYRRRFERDEAEVYGGNDGGLRFDQAIRRRLLEEKRQRLKGSWGLIRALVAGGMAEAAGDGRTSSSRRMGRLIRRYAYESLFYAEILGYRYHIDDDDDDDRGRERVGEFIRRTMVNNGDLPRIIDDRRMLLTMLHFGRAAHELVDRQPDAQARSPHRHQASGEMYSVDDSAHRDYGRPIFPDDLRRDTMFQRLSPTGDDDGDPGVPSLDQVGRSYDVDPARDVLPAYLNDQHGYLIGQKIEMLKQASFEASGDAGLRSFGLMAPTRDDGDHDERSPGDSATAWARSVEIDDLRRRQTMYDFEHLKSRPVIEIDRPPQIVRSREIGTEDADDPALARVLVDVGPPQPRTLDVGVGLLNHARLRTRTMDWGEEAPASTRDLERIVYDSAPGLRLEDLVRKWNRYDAVDADDPFPVGDGLVPGSIVDRDAASVESVDRDDYRRLKLNQSSSSSAAAAAAEDRFDLERALESAETRRVPGSRDPDESFIERLAVEAIGSDSARLSAQTEQEVEAVLEHKSLRGRAVRDASDFLPPRLWGDTFRAKYYLHEDVAAQIFDASGYVVRQRFYERMLYQLSRDLCETRLMLYQYRRLRALGLGPSETLASAPPSATELAETDVEAWSREQRRARRLEDVWALSMSSFHRMHVWPTIVERFDRALMPAPEWVGPEHPHQLRSHRIDVDGSSEVTGRVGEQAPMEGEVPYHFDGRPDVDQGDKYYGPERSDCPQSGVSDGGYGSTSIGVDWPGSVCDELVRREEVSAQAYYDDNEPRFERRRSTSGGKDEDRRRRRRRRSDTASSKRRNFYFCPITYEEVRTEFMMLLAEVYERYRDRHLRRLGLWRRRAQIRRPTRLRTGPLNLSVTWGALGRRQGDGRLASSHRYYRRIPVPVRGGRRPAAASRGTSRRQRRRQRRRQNRRRRRNRSNADEDADDGDDEPEDDPVEYEYVPALNRDIYASTSSDRYDGSRANRSLVELYIRGVSQETVRRWIRQWISIEGLWVSVQDEDQGSSTVGEESTATSYNPAYEETISWLYRQGYLVRPSVEHMRPEDRRRALERWALSRPERRRRRIRPHEVDDTPSRLVSLADLVGRVIDFGTQQLLDQSSRHCLLPRTVVETVRDPATGAPTGQYRRFHRQAVDDYVRNATDWPVSTTNDCHLSNDGLTHFLLRPITTSPLQQATAMRYLTEWLTSSEGLHEVSDEGEDQPPPRLTSHDLIQRLMQTWSGSRVVLDLDHYQSRQTPATRDDGLALNALRQMGSLSIAALREAEGQGRRQPTQVQPPNAPVIEWPDVEARITEIQRRPIDTIPIRSPDGAATFMWVPSVTSYQCARLTAQHLIATADRARWVLGEPSLTFSDIYHSFVDRRVYESRALICHTYGHPTGSAYLGEGLEATVAAAAAATRPVAYLLATARSGIVDRRVREIGYGLGERGDYRPTRDDDYMGGGDGDGHTLVMNRSECFAGPVWQHLGRLAWNSRRIFDAWGGHGAYLVRKYTDALATRTLPLDLVAQLLASQGDASAVVDDYEVDKWQYDRQLTGDLVSSKQGLGLIGREIRYYRPHSSGGGDDVGPSSIWSSSSSILWSSPAPSASGYVSKAVTMSMAERRGCGMPYSERVGRARCEVGLRAVDERDPRYDDGVGQPRSLRGRRRRRRYRVQLMGRSFDLRIQSLFNYLPDGLRWSGVECVWVRTSPVLRRQAMTTDYARQTAERTVSGYRFPRAAGRGAVVVFWRRYGSMEDSPLRLDSRGALTERHLLGRSSGAGGNGGGSNAWNEALRRDTLDVCDSIWKYDRSRIDPHTTTNEYGERYRPTGRDGSTTTQFIGRLEIVYQLYVRVTGSSRWVPSRRLTGRYDQRARRQSAGPVGATVTPDALRGVEYDRYVEISPKHATGLKYVANLSSRIECRLANVEEDGPRTGVGSSQSEWLHLAGRDRRGSDVGLGWTPACPAMDRSDQIDPQVEGGRRAFIDRYMLCRDERNALVNTSPIGELVVGVSFYDRLRL